MKRRIDSKVEGQRSYFQAINISSLPPDLSKYRMKISKGNWIAESKSDDTDFGPDGPHVSDDISCTFEEDNCLWSFVGGWSSTNYTDFSLGPPGAAQGEYYMQQYYINPLYLGSPLVTSPETACFTFKAYAREDAEIDTKIVNGNAVCVQSFPVAGSAGWQQFKMDVFVNPLEYNITLTSKSLGIFYDDFVFLNAQCDDLDLYGCDETEYMCTGSLECISRSTAFCNAVRDCPNGDDELTCTSCNEGAFLCGTKKCVPPESRCDGIPQCNDYSDEENCNGLNGGQIAGIVIGCLAGVALIVVLGVLVYSRSKKGRFV